MKLLPHISSLAACWLAASLLQAQTSQPPAPPVVHERADVTTTRSTVEVGATANVVTTLSSDDLTKYPALTLDERLRQHAGFELFRRSSTWVANPTSEGVSLRGLGSTAASRTLVLSSGVPLNDPFGGWIHWDEQPPETIESVTLASGGGSDLYGSSALGGVIDVVSAEPGNDLFEADLAAASEDTLNLSGRGDARQRRWDELLATEIFRTSGYITTAPSVRGTVDVPSNVHFENGRLEADRSLPRDQRAFVVANVLNEARSNGTPLQTNGTRLWRYIAGADWQAGEKLSGRARAFGSDQAYRQSFSSINATRSAETLTRLQHVSTQEFGVSADAAYHLTRVALIAGADLRDIRATDLEQPVNGLQDTTARQRFAGGFGELVAASGAWSGAASVRIDATENLSAHSFNRTGAGPLTSTVLPDRSESIPSARLGLVRELPAGFALRADAYRAFRTPTLNELYRTGQVGQQTTLANASLVSERATGAEGGANWASRSKALAAQATYFFTEINRPVSAVLLSSTAASQTLQRENLGQIQSQGVEVASQINPAGSLSGAFGYEYAHATVTSFAVQPGLVGLWIPQVPRHSATAQLRYRASSRADFTLAARQTGHAFDDSSNLYKLHGFFVLDAYAGGRLNQRLSVYVSLQNLLNRAIETARTPYLTLGTPFVAQGGLRISFGR
jgi:outer membrane receptor protein involved in Fe transport